MGAPLYRAVAEPAQPVTGLVARSGVDVGALGVEEPAFFGGEEEDEPVDKAEELLEVSLLRETTTVERGAEGLVLGMCEESLAERQQRVLNAPAQVLARPSAFLAAGGAPGLQRTVRQGTAGGTEP